MTRTMDGPLAAIRRKLRQRADPVKAEVLQKPFKTGPGEYAEGDCFLGLVVPTLRKIASTRTWDSVSGLRSREERGDWVAVGVQGPARQVEPSPSTPEYWIVRGFTAGDRFLVVVFEYLADDDIVIPVTAFEPEDI